MKGAEKEMKKITRKEYIDRQKKGKPVKRSKNTYWAIEV